MNASKTHWGQKIKQKVDEDGLHVGKLAKKLNVSKMKLYDLFKEEDLSGYWINKFCYILKYDFENDRDLTPDPLIERKLNTLLDRVEKLEEALNMA